MVNTVAATQTLFFTSLLPTDPWKNPYVYEPPSAGRPYRVISYGKDGLPGGETDDVDIDNFTIRERK